MKKAILAVLLVMFFVNTSFAAPLYWTVGEHFAGYTKEDFETAIELAMQKDVDALTEMVVDGKIFILNEGLKVYLLDTFMFSGMVKLRLFGKTRSFFTNYEAVGTKAK